MVSMDAQADRLHPSTRSRLPWTAAPWLAVLFLGAQPVAEGTPTSVVVASSGVSSQDSASVTWGPWQQIGPFELPGATAELATKLPPERLLPRMKPNGPGPTGEEEYKAFGSKVSWVALDAHAPGEDRADQAPIDFTQTLPANIGAGICTYLYRRIEATEATRVHVLMGSDDGMRLWLNGELTIDTPVPRGLRLGDETLAMDLVKGTNHLLVKVSNDGGAHGFQLRYEADAGGEGRGELQLRINSAIDLGVEWILARQQLDGSWGYMPQQYRNGQTSLSLYTLLKSGIPRDHQAIQRGLAYLRQRPPTKTYSAGCQLLALAATHDPTHTPWMEEIVERVLDWQQGGGWAYPINHVDLSNTQYAALGLRAAEQVGIDVSDKVWARMGEYTLGCQDNDGGFGYLAGRRSTGSMTSAGVGVLAMCLQALGEKGKVSVRSRKGFEEGIEQGTAWLARNFTVSTNPMPHGTDGGQTRWLEYYLYGLERVGSLLDVETIGAHAWYWEGARWLVDAQGDAGEWKTPQGEGLPNTCFAVLFLNRATRAKSGEGERKLIRRYGKDDPTVEVNLRASGDSPLVVWVSSFGDEIRDGAHWPEDRGDGPRVAWVRYLSGGEEIARVEGDPEAASDGERYAIRHSFPALGDYSIAAEVGIREPGAGPGEIRVLRAPALTVNIRALVEPWMLPYASEGQGNLLLDTRLDVEASSQKGNGTRGALAVDGLYATSWLTKGGDAEPRIRIEFPKPIKADRIVLAHARPSVTDFRNAARARVVEVYLNRNREPIRIEMDPESPLRVEALFERATSVRAFEVRILEWTPGTALKNAVGFAEIELRLED